MSISALAAVAEIAFAPVSPVAVDVAEEVSRDDPAGKPAAGRLGDGESRGDVRLAQLMCARVCHDLIGAAGAIESGVELLDEDPGDIADIHDLIGLSGRQLNRRLAFYRLAFGFAGGTGAGAASAGSLADARRVTTGLVEGGRIALHWNVEDEPEAADDGQCRAEVVSALLCSLLVAADALFRGGDLVVTAANGRKSRRFTVEATGRGACIAEPIVDALSAEGGLERITPRTVHAHYLGRLIHRLAARLDITRTADGFSLGLTVPARA